MKKLIALLLALVMVLALAACAAKTEPAKTETTTETTTTTEETTTEEAPAEETPAAETTGEKMYIPVMAKGFQHQFWQAVAAGSAAAAEDYNEIGRASCRERV